MERRRRIIAAAALALIAAACSGSSHAASPTEPPTAPASITPGPGTPGPGTPGPGTTAPGTTAPGTTVPGTTAPAPTLPPTTTPPTITTTPVTDTSGHVTGVFASVQGRGNATVALPASVGLPAIVHAAYNGSDKFVITTAAANGQFLSIAAQSVGNYDGTFPVGFVDEHNAPTAGLDVASTGAWHLDIANAIYAPTLRDRGVLGKGDAVLSYTGPAVGARVSYPGSSTFTIETFAHGSFRVLASAVGPYQRRITLPAGPAFISVTAAGDWSMRLG